MDPAPAFAVTVTISNIPSAISDQPFSFNVAVSGAQSGTNYLRANLFQEGTTSYFGYTYNGTDFINSSDYSQYLPISIDSLGNWSGEIKAKVDVGSKYYQGSGTYNLKVRRYTQSGSSYTWSNPIALTINIQSISPSPIESANPSTLPTSSFIISSIPSQINSDQDFIASVNLSLPDNPNSNFFLKGAFKKADSSNYFGLTKVNSNWIKNSNGYSSQFPIITDSSGNWSGNLEVKPDTDDSGFAGSGDYIFKVGRYSTSGSGPSWSNDAAINIIAVTSAESDTDSVTHTSTQTFSASPQITTISKSSPSVAQRSLYNPGRASTASVAAVSASTPSATPITKIQSQKINPIILIGLSLIATGLLIPSYIFLRSRIKSKVQ